MYIPAEHLGLLISQLKKLAPAHQLQDSNQCPTKITDNMSWPPQLFRKSQHLLDANKCVRDKSTLFLLNFIKVSRLGTQHNLAHHLFNTRLQNLLWLCAMHLKNLPN